jgi:hypothetical protein
MHTIDFDFLCQFYLVFILNRYYNVCPTLVCSALTTPRGTTAQLSSTLCQAICTIGLVQALARLDLVVFYFQLFN